MQPGPVGLWRPEACPAVSDGDLGRDRCHLCCRRSAYGSVGVLALEQGRCEIEVPFALYSSFSLETTRRPEHSGGGEYAEQWPTQCLENPGGY